MTTTMTATAARFTFDGSEIVWKQFRALEGEHHVFEPLGGGQFRHVARKAGTWATTGRASCRLGSVISSSATTAEEVGEIRRTLPTCTPRNITAERSARPAASAVREPANRRSRSTVARYVTASPSCGASWPRSKRIPLPGVDVAPRLITLRVDEPPPRKGGGKVADVAELVEKLKNEAGVI